MVSTLAVLSPSCANDQPRIFPYHPSARNIRWGMIATLPINETTKRPPIASPLGLQRAWFNPLAAPPLIPQLIDHCFIDWTTHAFIYIKKKKKKWVIEAFSCSVCLEEALRNMMTLLFFGFVRSCPAEEHPLISKWTDLTLLKSLKPSDQSPLSHCIIPQTIKRQYQINTRRAPAPGIHPCGAANVVSLSEAAEH